VREKSPGDQEASIEKLNMRARIFPKQRWKKIILIVTAVLVVSPFLLLRGVIFFMERSESPLEGATGETIPTTNGLSLRVYSRMQSNADVTLIFIHGSPGNARAFREQFAEPFPHANLIAYDRPGYGGSPGGKKELNLNAQVSALGYLLRAKQITNGILIGHSYGGPVALQGAIEFPDRVRGVVLIGGSVDPGQEKVRFIQRVGNLPIVRDLLPAALRNCNTEILALKNDLLALQRRLRDLRCPVVMLHGAKDPLVPVENVAYLEHELDADGQGALFHKIIFPDYNHFIPWEHPAAVRQAIAEVVDATKNAK
jgi:pimeloyl-ACP methyl ester carboxylesterase